MYVFWSTSELRVKLARHETSLSPPVKYFTDHSNVVLLSWIICVIYVLSRLFIAALWSPEGKGLTSWLLFVMFIVLLLLSHLVSWDCCCTWFLILAVFLNFTQGSQYVLLSVTPNINCIVSTWPNKRYLSHGMLSLSGHDDVALFEWRR